jgi:hypothetical protein
MPLPSSSLRNDLPAAAARCELKFRMARRVIAAALGIGCALLAGGDGYRYEGRALAATPTEEPAGRVLLAWRDSAGKVRAATIEKAKITTFLTKQSVAVARESEQVRARAHEKLTDETNAAFVAVRKRVPLYADWYFAYRTKYVLMSRAVRAGLTHVTVDMETKPHKADFIHAIEISLSTYLRREFAEKVVTPIHTQEQIEAAFEATLAVVRENWVTFLKSQDEQLLEFIKQEATPVDPSTALNLGREDRAPLPPMLGSMYHRDVFDAVTFRRGMLQIAVKRPRATAGGPASAETKTDDLDEGQDKIAQVMVNLFSSIVDPVAARGGDLLVSVAAGGIAGAMAGGSNLTIVGVAGAATGAAAIAPLAALFGGVISLSTDFAASKFEERLTRPSFEKDVTEIVTSTQEAVDRTLARVLDEHITAWRTDVSANTSIDRLVVAQ